MKDRKMVACSSTPLHKGIYIYIYIYIYNIYIIYIYNIYIYIITGPCEQIK